MERNRFDILEFLMVIYEMIKIENDGFHKLVSYYKDILKKDFVDFLSSKDRDRYFELFGISQKLLNKFNLYGTKYSRFQGDPHEDLSP